MAVPINSLYSLTWGDYGTSLVSAIQLLRCHGDLVDCTLAAGGRSFPAHKIVLCAASPFLLELLKNTPCKHPVVMLAGVNAHDLEALLEFVYRGEVSVDHSQLPSLLQAAHCLNIQGLAPQTVATPRDEYTTQIQLHPVVTQQNEVKAVIGDQEQIIATITDPQTATTQTVHAQVVEDIHPNTITSVEDVKDVISQLLPARKRKQRTIKKPGDNTNKVIRKFGQETATGTSTSAKDEQKINVTATTIKTEPPSSDTVITVANVANVANTTTSGSTTTVGTSTANQINQATKTTTTTNAQKPRSKSQSEQPATCPICFAVIRQSRNLRRHLELRHFAKPGVKKERKTTTQKKVTTTTTATTGNATTPTKWNTTQFSTTTIPSVQSVQTLHTLQTIQVKKDPDSSPALATPVTMTVASTGQQTQQAQQVQQQTATIIDQSGQQQQILTQNDNGDGTTSLHIQTLAPGHQLTMGNIQGGKNHNILVKKVFILKGNNNA